MGDGMDEPFIHFTPHAPDPLRATVARRPSGGAGRHQTLPPEALGRWSAPASGSPLAAPSERGAPWTAERPAPLRPVPASSPAVGPAQRGSGDAGARAASAGAATAERRDARTAYQDEWLNGVRRARREVEVVYLDGGLLRGRIASFDTYALVLESAGSTVLVFKHAIRLLRAIPEVAPRQVP